MSQSVESSDYPEPVESNPDPRPDRVSGRSVDEIIPFPVLAGTFLFLLYVIYQLLSPGWAENMRAVIARRESRAGNHIVALGYYEKLAKIRSSNPTYLGELAFTQAKLGKYDEAVANYKKATEALLAIPPPVTEERGYVRPTPDHYSAEIGAALFGAKKYAEAKGYLDRYIRNVDRRHAASHYYMAQICLEENDLANAAIHMGAAKDNGFPDDYLKPIRQALVDKQLPPELR